MISNSRFELGNDKMEIFPMDKNAFPYICYYAEMDSYINKNFSWHWHRALEIDYIAEGEAEIKSTSQTFHLKKGDAIFINSNVMHDIRAWNNMKNCKIYAHIFDMHFLSGMYNSVYEKKYLLPIMKSRDLQLYPIHPDSYTHILMLEKILHLLKLADEEPFGFEFELRSELCRFWCLFFEETAALCTNHSKCSNIDEDRLKQMLDFIHSNYKEKITLDEIAASANIGSRECTRCFQRCIGISPVNYLISYRIRMAAQMLLTTDHSIITVSEDCGFSSASYFGKIFHDCMKCTPGQYRNQRYKTSEKTCE